MKGIGLTMDSIFKGDVMTITLEEAKVAAREYHMVFQVPQGMGFGIGVGCVGLEDKKAEETQRNDYCLVVNVYKPFPQGYSLPDEEPERYKGMRVFVKASGQPRPLGNKRWKT